jgi:hypothetical protein
MAFVLRRLSVQVLRDDFKYVPRLSRDQFFSAGFAEQKAILVTDVARLCVEKHELLSRQVRCQRLPRGPASASSLSSHERTHVL